MKLLDNKEYNKEDLLAGMVDDDFYYNFLGTKRCLSYSTAKYLLKSPKYFQLKLKSSNVETQALRDGRLIHAQILEPSKYKQLKFIDVSSKRVKKWTEAVKEFGSENCYTMKEKYINNAIVRSFMQNNACLEYLKGTQKEVGAIETLDDIPFRGKADILGEDFVADVKTTNDGVSDLGSKNQFEYTVSKYDYDLQAYLYTRLFNKPRFVWLVIDKSTTDIGIFEASEELLERGRNKFNEALGVYKAFFVDKLINLNQYYITKTI